MRIFAGGIATETNTFSPLPTALDDFVISRAEDRLDAALPPMPDPRRVWGDRAAALGHEFIFSLLAWAPPAGVTTRAAYRALRTELLDRLQAAMPVDAALLMLHGAMVADGCEDCEADLIAAVRGIVGFGAVIGVFLDLHCHLTDETISEADLVVTMKEYPHVDMDERAVELFELTVATAERRIRPAVSLFDCRMVGFYPTTREPMRGFVDAMLAAEREPGVLSLSFVHGFPPADVPGIGAKMLAITDGDKARAEALARTFGRRAHALRREIALDALTVPLEAALEEAAGLARGPCVVAEVFDNPGGGAPGDAMAGIRWLLEHQVPSAAAIVHDPEAVKLLRKAGAGARLPLRLGGKASPHSGAPLDLEVEVLALRDDYGHAFPQAGGKPAVFQVGAVAAIRSGSIDIVVGSVRCQCFTPEVFSDLDVSIADKQVLLVKSAQHFHAGFVPIAARILYASGRGVVSPDPRDVPYVRFDGRGVYPWAVDPFSEEAPK